MDFDEEIKWSRLIIALHDQYKKQASDGDIKGATETLKKLTNMKSVNVKLFEKVALLSLKDYL